ncbi:unnamed protein product, partial [Brenthis ino]
MYFVSTLMGLLFGYGQTLDANCDFERNILADRDYYINSLNYPESYSAGARCRWIGKCPKGYNCRLDCDDIDLPQTPSCSGDRVVISRTGDPLLTSGETYCGAGSLTVVSTGQKISIGLITALNTTGGKFSCKLAAQLQSTTPLDLCQCGYQGANRIVGGTETRSNEFPMMAGIVYVDEAAIKCGAVIISRTVVVTAAHCVINKRKDNVAVIVGEPDTATGARTYDCGGDIFLGDRTVKTYIIISLTNSRRWSMPASFASMRAPTEEIREALSSSSASPCKDEGGAFAEG